MTYAWQLLLLETYCPVDVYVGGHTPGHGRVNAADGPQEGLVRISKRRPAWWTARMKEHPPTPPDLQLLSRETGVL
jgi:hypothetical protein